MKKVCLKFKGDARVMFFGKEGWNAKEVGNVPECNKAFIGFTRIDSLECEGREMFNMLGSLVVPQRLYHVHSSRLEDTGEFLLSYSDVKDAELKITLSVADDFVPETLMLYRDANYFEGYDVFWMTNVFYGLIEGNDITGEYAAEDVAIIFSQVDNYTNCANRLQ